MRILSLLFGALLAASAARAEPIASAPGWSLSRIAEPAQEENVYTEVRVYFSLKPPDARPAISVDSHMADRLRSGEANAENTYSGNQAPKNEDAQDGSGGRGSGFQAIDPINSTLTADEGRKDGPTTLEGSAAPRSLANQGGGFAGFGNSGLSSDSGRATAAKALSMRNNSAAVSAAVTTGASSAPNSAAAAASGGSRVSDDPRQIASRNIAPPANRLAEGAFAANNVASGFGVGASSQTNTTISVWPGGDPATITGTISTTVSSNCSNATLTFDSPTFQRISVPKGCVGIKIDAFGAGGGAGSSVSTDTATNISAEGGGGTYVHVEGKIDGASNDIVVIVGSAGGDGSAAKAGLAGFVGGGSGGEGGGGGGGGYSGVFLADRALFNNGEKPVLLNEALAVAAGGGGGSAKGGAGGSGGVQIGGGVLGATQAKGGPKEGSGRAGNPLLGGATGPFGGGGGGGYFGGGGGGREESENITSASGGGGGSSFAGLEASAAISTAARDAVAGNASFSNRHHAGDAGKAGLVIVTFY